MALFHNPPRRMSHTLRALAWLLRYPTDALRENLGAVREALHEERALTFGRLSELDALIDRLAALPPLRAEAEYVDLFDRGRRTSLHLFEHVHGDSRDRGPAMIDLTQTYERAGLLLGDGELPDFLPVVLEFASTQPPAEAVEFLRETAHIVRALFTAMLERPSPQAALFAAVLAAVLDLAGEKAERVPLPEEPALDESWAEPEAFGGCSSQGQARPDQPQPIHIHRSTERTSGRTAGHASAHGAGAARRAA
ncbi:MAG: nitrate reductase molybdenum cofactor assembly chaperone [Burkholderiales bacterium]|nr:nitrate reductase molybdenum cofactor assembly chaperone [Burkholderiales bacterium]